MSDGHLHLAAVGELIYNLSMTPNLINEIVQPMAECLTVEAARKLVAFQASEALQDRMDDLAEKSNRGESSYPDSVEYNEYIAALNFLTIMQSRARQLLKDASVQQDVVAHG